MLFTKNLLSSDEQGDYSILSAPCQRFFSKKFSDFRPVFALTFSPAPCYNQCGVFYAFFKFFQIIQEGTLPAFAGPRLGFGMRHARELDRFSLINRRNIQYTNYTQSLITEALRVRLLQAAFVDDLQMQIMGQLELLIRRFPADRALPPEQISAHNQALLDGIFFTLDTYLLSFHDPMYALSALQSESVTEMYTAGQQQLRAHYLETVALLVKARKIDSAALLPKLRKTLQTEIHEALLQHRPQFCSRTPHPFSYP